MFLAGASTPASVPKLHGLPEVMQSVQSIPVASN